VQRRPPALHEGLVEVADALLHLHRGFEAVAHVVGFATGAPQKAMIASPMYLSIVPRRSWITSVIAVR
jgi:hypothetical protein